MSMATALLLIPSMAIMILLLNPTGCSAVTPSKQLLNHSASNWCDTHLGKCLVGEDNADSEFLMDTVISRMLLGFQNFQTGNTVDRNKVSVPECNRPPRYDSCLGNKRSNPPSENCDPRNRVNPCGDQS